MQCFCTKYSMQKLFMPSLSQPPYSNSISSRSAVSLSDHCVWLQKFLSKGVQDSDCLLCSDASSSPRIKSAKSSINIIQLILLTLNHTVTQQYSNITPWKEKKTLLHVIAVVSPLPSNSLTEVIKLADARSSLAFGIRETASHNNSQR